MHVTTSTHKMYRYSATMVLAEGIVPCAQVHVHPAPGFAAPLSRTWLRGSSPSRPRKRNHFPSRPATTVHPLSRRSRIMSVPFGFSVGDFLAVIKLIWDLPEALSESAGSIQEVHLLLVTLFSFQRLISTCQAFALEWQQLYDKCAETSTPERSVVNGINHQLAVCRAKLEKLVGKMQPYTWSFMKQRGSRSVRDQVRKVKWMFAKEELVGLRSDLATHVDGLEHLTAALERHVESASRVEVLLSASGGDETNPEGMGILRGGDHFHRAECHLHEVAAGVPAVGTSAASGIYVGRWILDARPSR